MVSSVDLADVEAFASVVDAGGFRQAARATGKSSSGLSDAVRRLESRLEVRLLYRTRPDVEIEVIARSEFVDVLAAGFDAGIRYDDSLAKDMVAVPIGPRRQRFARLSEAVRNAGASARSRAPCLPVRTHGQRPHPRLGVRATANASWWPRRAH